MYAVGTLGLVDLYPMDGHTSVDPLQIPGGRGVFMLEIMIICPFLVLLGTLDFFLDFLLGFFSDFLEAFLLWRQPGCLSEDSPDEVLVSEDSSLLDEEVKAGSDCGRTHLSHPRNQRDLTHNQLRTSLGRAPRVPLCLGLCLGLLIFLIPVGLLGLLLLLLPEPIRLGACFLINFSHTTVIVRVTVIPWDE